MRFYDFFTSKFQQIYSISVSGHFIHFIFKICQTVVGIFRAATIDFGQASGGHITGVLPQQLPCSILQIPSKTTVLSYLPLVVTLH